MTVGIIHVFQEWVAFSEDVGLAETIVTVNVSLVNI